MTTFQLSDVESEWEVSECEKEDTSRTKEKLAKTIKPKKNSRGKNKATLLDYTANFVWRDRHAKSVLAANRRAASLAAQSRKENRRRVSLLKHLEEPVGLRAAMRDFVSAGTPVPACFTIPEHLIGFSGHQLCLARASRPDVAQYDRQLGHLLSLFRKGRFSGILWSDMYSHGVDWKRIVHVNESKTIVSKRALEDLKLQLLKDGIEPNPGPNHGQFPKGSHGRKARGHWNAPSVRQSESETTVNLVELARQQRIKNEYNARNLPNKEKEGEDEVVLEKKLDVKLSFKPTATAPALLPVPPPTAPNPPPQPPAVKKGEVYLESCPIDGWRPSAQTFIDCYEEQGLCVDNVTVSYRRMVKPDEVHDDRLVCDRTIPVVREPIVFGYVELDQIDEESWATSWWLGWLVEWWFCLAGIFGVVREDTTHRRFIFCPHMVSVALASYDLNVTQEQVDNSARQKILRLPSLPVPQTLAAQVLAGSEIVIKLVACNQLNALGAGCPVSRPQTQLADLEDEWDFEGEDDQSELLQRDTDQARPGFQSRRPLLFCLLLRITSLVSNNLERLAINGVLIIVACRIFEYLDIVPSASTDMIQILSFVACASAYAEICRRSLRRRSRHSRNSC